MVVTVFLGNGRELEASAKELDEDRKKSTRAQRKQST